MMESPSERERAVRILNTLLRCEISAAESYTQAIPRLSFAVDALREIAREHGQTVSDLRAAIQRVGGVPEETSGVFPALPAKAVFGPAQVFADAATLQALKDVEERALGDYQDAVKRLNGANTGWIADALIPAQIKHINSLDDMLASL